MAADRESHQLFTGHGTVIAQVYNHMIMPLANGQDKITQVRWGLRDFEHRFGRPPDGLWLAETAVDLETLEIPADHGLRSTILAPSQARHEDPTGGLPSRHKNLDIPAYIPGLRCCRTGETCLHQNWLN